MSLFYVEQLSVREIAASMKLSEGAVKYHLHAGRGALRAWLGPARRRRSRRDERRPSFDAPDPFDDELRRRFAGRRAAGSDPDVVLDAMRPQLAGPATGGGHRSRARSPGSR